MGATAFALTMAGTTAAQAQDAIPPRDYLSPAAERLHVVDAELMLDQHSVAIAHRLRLRMVGVSTSFPTVSTMRLHGRYATAVVDFFPLADSGFHLSAGTRFHVRRDFFGESTNVTRGLLFIPRGNGGPPRTGFKKFQPVATMGYTGALTSSISLGLEAGVRLGSSFMGPRFNRLGAGWQGQTRAARAGGNRNQPNPMVNAVLGFRF